MAKRDKRRPTAPEICPVCDEDVPRNASACPECGADHNSGWREGVEIYDGVDLPGDFNYEEFTRREFGNSPAPAAIKPVWWVTAIFVLLVTLIYLFVGR